MIARLVLLYLFPFLSGCVFVHFAVIRPRLRARHQRQLAQARVDFACLGCNAYVDPESQDSLYEAGRWMHSRCRQELLS